MSVLNIILLVLLFVSGIMTIVLVLMHSGKGTGISDMITSSLYNSNAGTGVIEKNLNRLTIICVVVFIACIVIMSLTFPLGTISY